MHEGQGAAASGIAGIGLPSLTWGLDKMGVEIPYKAAVAISVLSIALVVLSLVLAGHLFWKWISTKQSVVRYWNKGGKIQAGALVVLALGIAIGLITSRIGAFWQSDPDTGPIVWNFAQSASGRAYFLDWQKPDNQEINVVGFGATGKNMSAEPINDFQGYVRSDVTNKAEPLYILAANAPVAHVCSLVVPTLPENTEGIPAFSAVNVVTRKKPFYMNVTYADTTPISKFENEFAPFTVVLKYGGKEYKRQFSREEVERQKALIEKLSGPPTDPYVARKDNAPSIEDFPPLSPIIKPQSQQPWHLPVDPDLTGTVLEKK
jgi:hypothetical protein